MAWRIRAEFGQLTERGDAAYRPARITDAMFTAWRAAVRDHGDRPGGFQLALDAASFAAAAERTDELIEFASVAFTSPGFAAEAARSVSRRIEIVAAARMALAGGQPAQALAWLRLAEHHHGGPLPRTEGFRLAIEEALRPDERSAASVALDRGRRAIRCARWPRPGYPPRSPRPLPTPAARGGPRPRPQRPADAGGRGRFSSSRARRCSRALLLAVVAALAGAALLLRGRRVGRRGTRKAARGCRADLRGDRGGSRFTRPLSRLSRGGPRPMALSPSSLPSRADVVIVGAGAVGAATAWYLAEEKGLSVAVLEARAVAAGSTSRSAAAFRQQFSNRAHVKMSLFARGEYERFPETFGVAPVFVQNGYLFLYTEADAMAAARTRVEWQQAEGVTDAARPLAGRGRRACPASTGVFETVRSRGRHLVPDGRLPAPHRDRLGLPRGRPAARRDAATWARG